MRLVSKLKRKVLLYLQKHRVRSEFKPNNIVLRPILYLYLYIYFIGHERKLKIDKSWGLLHNHTSPFFRQCGQ
jgi:hypothetical protein